MDKYAFDFNLQSLAGEIVQRALSQFKNFKQIRERPFEILFKYGIPGIMMLKGNFVLSILFGAAQEIIGIGPETIGAMIDRAIGKGPGSDESQPVSESSLKNASEGIIEKITNAIFSKSSSFRTEIEKNGLSIQAFIIAWANGPDKIEKQAVNWASKFRSMIGMQGYAAKGLFSGTLYHLLKAILIGVGISTGTSLLYDAIGGKKVTFPSEKSVQTAPGMRMYQNPFNDVEQSLVATLDRLIKDKNGKPFSTLFTELKGYSPIGSQEMDRLLGEVRAAHGGASIQEINNYKSFAAPPIAEIAKMLFPQATYTKQSPPTGDKKPETKLNTEKEFEDIFGGTK